MAQGMARDEAERAARREFGNLNVLHEEARDARGGRRLESLAADARFGLRQLARRPVSTITMVVVLALGIGFNTALFVLVSSFVRGVPAGFTPDESLVRIRGIDRNQSRGFGTRARVLVLGVPRVHPRKRSCLAPSRPGRRATWRWTSRARAVAAGGVVAWWSMVERDVWCW